MQKNTINRLFNWDPFKYKSDGREPCSACGQCIPVGYNAPVLDSEGEDDVDSCLHGEDRAMFKQISFESQVAKLKLKVHKAELLVHECKLDMHRAEMWLKENLNDLLQLELGKRIFDLQASAVRKREQDGAPKKPVCCGNNEGDSARIVRLSFEKQFDQRKLRVSNAENTVKQATLEVDEAELELKKLLSKLTQLELNKSKSDHQTNPTTKAKRPRSSSSLSWTSSSSSCSNNAFSCESSIGGGSAGDNAGGSQHKFTARLGSLPSATKTP